MISYRPLRALLERKHKSLYHLTRDKIVGKATLEVIRLDAGNISTSTVSDICAYLNCQPGDIMEYVPDEPEPPQSL